MFCLLNNVRRFSFIIHQQTYIKNIKYSVFLFLSSFKTINYFNFFMSGEDPSAEALKD